MKDFALIDFTSGAFPDVTADQSSGSTVRDGTPLDADWVNDLWGAFQAILTKAFVTPSGSSEASTVSDVLDSIRKIAGAPGEIVYWGGRDSDAITHGNRLLLLAGQVISLATYPELTTAIYCGDTANPTASSFYKTSDAGGTTRSTSGTYLVLPDCRGAFIRALNGAAGTRDTGRIADGTEYEPGSIQSYQAGTHDHLSGWWSSPVVKSVENTDYWVYPADPGGSAVEDTFVNARATAIDPVTNLGDGRTYLGGFDTTGTDEETRPANLAFHLMIRY